MSSSNRNAVDKVFDKKNAGNFSVLTDDTIAQEIVEKNLYLPDISKLRQTCSFFAYHPKITTSFGKKQWKILASGNQTFIVHDNHVFAIGNNRFNCLGLERKEFYYEPELVLLPNGNVAVNVIASPNRAF